MQFDYVLDQVNESYTLAHKLVSFGTYHSPTCDSGPSNWGLAWSSNIKIFMNTKFDWICEVWTISSQRIFLCFWTPYNLYALQI